MKKSLSLVIVVVMVLTVLFAGNTVVLAEDVVDWNASLSPSSLSTGGTVTFSSSIKNLTSNPITEVVIIYPDGSSHQVGGGTIAAGASESYSDSNYSVATDQLDKDLQFTLSCKYTNAAGEQASYQKYATGKVTKKAGTVSVTGTTTSNKDTISKAGDKVTLTFVFKNTGDTEVTDCRLFASPLNDGKEITQKPFSLAAGASKTLNYSSSLSKTTTISPKLTFTADGKSQSITTNTVEVKLEGDTPVEPEPTGTTSMKLTAIPNQTEVVLGDTVEFTITVENTGTEKLSDVAVDDGSDSSISLSKTSLAEGESASGKVSYTVTEDSSYEFYATALNSAGEIAADESGAIKITVGGEDPDVPKGLYIDVIAENQQLEKAGDAKFVITVSNTSDVELQNVVVSEANTGEIATIPTLGTDIKTIEHTIAVSKTTNYVFTVTAQLADGTEVSATTDPVTVTVAETGPDMGAVIIGIIIIAAAVLVVVLLVLRHKKKKNANKNNPKGGNNTRSYNGNSRQKDAYDRQRAEYNRPMRQRTQSNEGGQPRNQHASSFVGETDVNEYNRQQKQNYDFTVENEPSLSNDAPVRSDDMSTGTSAENSGVTRRALNVEPKQGTIPRHEVKKRGDRNNF